MGDWLIDVLVIIKGSDGGNGGKKGGGGGGGGLQFVGIESYSFSR
jgi:hypothetical protein